MNDHRSEWQGEADKAYVNVKQSELLVTHGKSQNNGKPSIPSLHQCARNGTIGMLNSNLTATRLWMASVSLVTGT